MKTIYLVRHGDYNDDNSLTSLGIRQIEKAAEGIKTDCKDINDIIIYHSNAKRTLESAEVIAKVLSEIQTKIVLSPNLSVDKKLVEEAVEACEGTSILVGHQPDLEQYARRFERKSKQKYFTPLFHKGSCYKLVVDESGKETLEQLVE